MKLQTGFTLIELMIVVAVVAILSSIAIPAYNDHVTRGKINEATAALSDLRVRMEQYYQDNRSYIGTLGACGVGAAPAAGTRYFTITCGGALPHPSAATANSYIIAATGIGGMANFRYTIDQSNARATPGVPARWGPVSATCWITKVGGLC